MVRITVNLPEAAAAVPEIKRAHARRRRRRAAHRRLPLQRSPAAHPRIPDCAAALDKYRINPGNVGTGKRRDEQFATICQVAIDHGKPVRIGVNGGSLNQELVMREDAGEHRPRPRQALRRHRQRVHGAVGDRIDRAGDRTGLRQDQIIISCKLSRPRHLIDVYRALARQTEQPLHLGLTEAGMGIKGLVWSASAMGVLLSEGIGDTDPRVADAAAGRRSARRGLRRLRAAAGARPAHRSRRASPRARAAAAPPAPRSRSSPKPSRTTSASRCRRGRRTTTASRR